ncbi:MAG: alpha-L-fucosidase, partial [Candidatus Hydrogenedentes bacterium]|nr:alpha-L-fucosidase [Candidatus Hydrogenedentota bacterium]
PHRDLCGDLTAAVKDAGLKMGFYFSFYEWFNPIYNSDVDRYVEEHMLPQLTDLVMKYEPDLVWPDGEWEHPSATWRSTEFLAWLFNESPVKDTVAVNDRWGKDCRGQHGGFYTTEYQPDQGKDMDRKWEECRGIGHSFGYNRNENRDNYDTPDTLIERLVDIVAHGGNLLLDIGPTADGRIPVIMQERLLQMGEWMDVNGEAIYGTQPWRVTSDNDRLYYTAKAGAVYAIALDWPEGSLTLNNVKPTDAATVQLLGHDGNLEWERTDDGMTIHVPALSVETTPTHWAHVFKLMGVE